MKRFKAKPKKQKKINVSVAKLNKIKRDVTDEATHRAWLLLIVAVIDEFGLSEDQLCDLAVRMDRYASHVDNHLVKTEDVRKIIEDRTGIQLHGW